MRKFIIYFLLCVMIVFSLEKGTGGGRKQIKSNSRRKIFSCHPDNNYFSHGFKEPAFAAENKQVLLRWKVPGGRAIGFKTSMAPNRVDEQFLKFNYKDLQKGTKVASGLFNELAKLRLPAKYPMVTIVKPDLEKNFDVEIIQYEEQPATKPGTKPEDSKSKPKVELQLSGKISNSGKIITFYMQPRQKNILALFFQLPEKPVKVGDTWPVKTNFISIGAGFICEEAEKSNRVAITN